jgi:hypothetical protein
MMLSEHIYKVFSDGEILFPDFRQSAKMLSKRVSIYQPESCLLATPEITKFLKQLIKYNRMQTKGLD